MSQNSRKKNLRHYHFKNKTADLWDILGVDAVNWVAHVLPGGDQQREPQQADHWTQEHHNRLYMFETDKLYRRSII
jgi:hypothetical protein